MTPFLPDAAERVTVRLGSGDAQSLGDPGDQADMSQLGATAFQGRNLGLGQTHQAAEGALGPAGRAYTRTAESLRSVALPQRESVEAITARLAALT